MFRAMFFAIGLFAMISSASASTLDCRLMGINDGPADVKPIFINASPTPQEIGSLGGETITVSEMDGVLEIRALGPGGDVSAAAKTDDIYLSIKGLSAECSVVPSKGS